MTPDQLRSWFEQYLDACNRHDLELIREYLHPQVRRAGATSGADAWLRDLADLFTAFPDHRWKRITLVVQDDRIAAHLRTRGTHRGPFRGHSPTGRHIGVAEFAFYRVVEGRITEYAGTADHAELLEQLLGRTASSQPAPADRYGDPRALPAVDDGRAARGRS